MRNIKFLWMGLALFIFKMANAQNLLVNPGAESAPAGTGWTIISSGVDGGCAAGTAANTYSNWTMTPDASINYPAAHGGTKTFFSGCNTPVPAGPFELRQDINVSSDAAAIDAGTVAYTFSGYIQTPISNQGDNGRFIVDYLNAASAILGTSYTSAYQSGTGGSGATWKPYTNLRTAPTGTRTVRVRLQTNIVTGPAINAYFDDLSIVKSAVLPITLVSFSGKEENKEVILKWSVSNAVNFSRFDVEQSINASDFTLSGSILYQSRETDYSFSNQMPANIDNLFYRLKMLDIDGKFRYSPVLMITTDRANAGFSIYPNPAHADIVVTGLEARGSLTLLNLNGNKIMQVAVNANSLLLDIGWIQKGIYVLTYDNGKTLVTKKLIINN